MTDENKDITSLDDGDTGAAQIKLVSKDGKEFHLDKKFAFVSNLIKTSLEHGQLNTHQREQSGDSERAGDSSTNEQASGAKRAASDNDSQRRLSLLSAVSCVCVCVRSFCSGGADARSQG